MGVAAKPQPSTGSQAREAQLVQAKAGVEADLHAIAAALEAAELRAMAVQNDLRRQLQALPMLSEESHARLTDSPEPTARRTFHWNASDFFLT